MSNFMIRRWRGRFSTAAVVVALALALAGCGGMEPEVVDQDEEALTAIAIPFCGYDTTAPTLFSKTVVGPAALNANGTAPFGFNPEFGRVQRGIVQYVSANYVHVKLVTDQCTVIKEVRVGDRVLTTSFQDGYRYYAAASYPQPADTSQYSHSVYVFFPYDNEGTTENVKIVVRRTGGQATASYSFPLVRVDAVYPHTTVATVGLSDTELYNKLARKLYDKFGGALNETKITQSDGTERRIYGLDHDSIYLYVNGYGVHFGFKFKIDIDNWCDPTAKVHGVFKLGTDSNGLYVVWTLPPQTTLDWPGLCLALSNLPIAGLIPELINSIIDGEASDSILSSVKKDIQDALPDTTDYALLLDGARVQTNQVLVDLRLPYPQVELEVPYDAFDMGRPATAFNANEMFVVLAHGIGMQEGSKRSGPDGLPNAWPSPPPIEETLYRSNLAALPYSGANVAQLVAKQWQTRYQYKWGCGIKSSTVLGVNYISFGVNDTPTEAQQLRTAGAQGYKVRLGFVKPALQGSVTPCPSKVKPLSVKLP